jgi:hypothetical protein
MTASRRQYEQVMCCLPDASTSDAGCCLRFRRPAPPRRLAVALSRVCGRLQRRPREARKGRPAGLRRRSQIRGRSLRRADAEESAVALAREESEHSLTRRTQTSASTKTGNSHATCRGAIRLLHPARSSSAAKAPLSFGDEHLCRREQRPAWRGKRDSRRGASMV